MDESFLTYYITSMGLIILMGIYIVLSGQFGWFGLKRTLHRMRHKNSSGLFFPVNKAGNFQFPKLINLNADTHKVKEGGIKKDYPIHRDQLQTGRFWGQPFIIYNVDDVKTNVGIYYQRCNEKGEPLFLEYKTEDGKIKKMPSLSPLAPSISLSPTWLDALVGDRALTQALKDLFNKHRTTFYVLGALAIGVGFSSYVSYELTSTYIPQIMEELRALKELVSQGVDYRQ